MIGVIELHDVTIPSGAAVSNEITSKMDGDAIQVALYAPAALDALTFTIEVRRKGGAGTYVTLQAGSTPADLAPPLAGKGRVYPELGAVGGWRIKASGNVAADRTWEVTRSAYIE